MFALVQSTGVDRLAGRSISWVGWIVGRSGNKKERKEIAR